MPINEEGRQMLIADIGALKPYYDQRTFGRIGPLYRREGNSCGTVLCMAGLCFLRKVGWEKYTKALGGDYIVFMKECVTAGKAQLGFPMSDSCPLIFEGPSLWPSPFRERYLDAERINDLDTMAEVAIDALQSIDDHGNFVVVSS